MSQPLSDHELHRLLSSESEARRADLLVLRDALDRMADALEELGSAVGELHHVARRADPALEREARRLSEQPGLASGSGRIPPRAD